MAVFMAVLLCSCAGVQKSAAVQGTGEPQAVLPQADVLQDQLPKEEPPARSSLNVPNAKFAFLGPISGENREYGRKILHGAEAAVRDYNSSRGANITILQFDTSSSEVSVKALMQNISSDREVLGVIGPVTVNGIKDVIEGANELLVPTVTPTVFYPEEIPGNRYFFKNNVSPEDEGRTLAEYLSRASSIKKIAVIRNDSVFSKACSSGFIKAASGTGLTIVAEAVTEQGRYDLKDQMLLLGGVDPHIIKDIAESDKQNLEAAAAKLVLHVRSLLPQKSTASRVLLLPFVNTGSEGITLKEEQDHGLFFSKKLSYGLARQRDIEMVEMAKVAAYFKKAEGTLREKASFARKEFGAAFFISGRVDKTSPDNYYVTVRVDPEGEGAAPEVSFGFSVSPVPEGNSLGIEAFYIPQDPEDSYNIMSHLAFFDLKAPCLGTGRWLDEDFLRRSAGKMEGAFFTAPYYPKSAVPVSARFTEFYRSIYFEEPDEFASFGFDTAKLMLYALDNGVNSRDGLAGFLSSIKGYGGVNGLSVHSGGRFVKTPGILTVVSGELKEVR